VRADPHCARNAGGVHVHGGGVVAHSIQIIEMHLPARPPGWVSRRGHPRRRAERRGKRQRDAHMPASLAAVTDATPQPAAAAWRPGVPRRVLVGALLAALLLAGALALVLAGG